MNPYNGPHYISIKPSGSEIPRFKRKTADNQEGYHSLWHENETAQPNHKTNNNSPTERQTNSSTQENIPNKTKYDFNPIVVVEPPVPVSPSEERRALKLEAPRKLSNDGGQIAVRRSVRVTSRQSLSYCCCCGARKTPQNVASVVRGRTDSLKSGYSERVRCNKTKVCFKGFMAFLFSQLGLTLLLAGYCAAGAFIFRALERDNQVSVERSSSTDLEEKRTLLYGLVWELHHTLVRNSTNEMRAWVSEHMPEVIEKIQNDTVARIKSRIIEFGDPRAEPYAYYTHNETLAYYKYPIHLEDPPALFNLNDSVLTPLLRFSQGLEHTLFNVTQDYVTRIIISSEKLVQSAYRACESGCAPPIDREHWKQKGMLLPICRNCTVCRYNANSPNNVCRPTDWGSIQSARLSVGGEAWNIAAALLYALTVITTIGYGHIVPRTNIGRFVTVLYAIVGIPLGLLVLASLGRYLADCVRFVYLHSCLRLHRRRQEKKMIEKISTEMSRSSSSSPPPASGAKREKKGIGHANFHNGFSGTNRAATAQESPMTVSAVDKSEVNSTNSNEMGERKRYTDGQKAAPGISRVKNSLNTFRKISQTTYQALIFQRFRREKSLKDVHVPIWLSLLVFTSYLFAGAIIYSNWEAWTFLDSAYFVFITLSTIGFGDMVPGAQTYHWYQNPYKPIFCCFYLILGLSVVAMCFDLMQKEVKNKFRRLIRKIRSIGRESNDEELSDRRMV